MCELLDLPTNIRLSWKGLPGTKSLAYYKYSQIIDVKKFVTLSPGEIWRAIDATK